MRVRPTIVVLAAMTALLAPSARAADPAPQVTDPESDANYLNDNAPVVLPADHPLNNNPTPAGSDAGADILSIQWKTLKEKGATAGFTVTMVLKAAPKSGVLFRATAETADCSTLWFQYYSTDPGNTPQASLRHTCDGGAVVVPVLTSVKENVIEWTFAFKSPDMPKIVKAGTELIRLGGHSRPFVTNPTCVDATRCTTNPVQADVTNNVPGPYKVGS